MAGFRANPRLARDLAKQPTMRAVVKAKAREAASLADEIARQAGAPWMQRSARTVVVDDDGQAVRIVNTDHAAHLQEWGGKNNPPHAPLRRGVRAAGLHLTEDPK